MVLQLQSVAMFLNDLEQENGIVGKRANANVSGAVFLMQPKILSSEYTNLEELVICYQRSVQH